MMLILPSLPSPSGVAWWLWSWVKPKIYDHLKWSASKYGDWTDNTKHMSIFVVILVSNDEDANSERLSVPEVCGIWSDRPLHYLYVWFYSHPPNYPDIHWTSPQWITNLMWWFVTFNYSVYLAGLLLLHFTYRNGSLLRLLIGGPPLPCNLNERIVSLASIMLLPLSMWHN